MEYEYDVGDYNDLGFYDSDESNLSDYVEDELIEEPLITIPQTYNHMYLPDDMMKQILLKSDMNEYIKLCNSSKKLKKLCDNNMWKNKFIQNNWLMDRYPSNENDWYNLYRTQMNVINIYKIVDRLINSFDLLNENAFPILLNKIYYYKNNNGRTYRTIKHATNELVIFYDRYFKKFAVNNYLVSFKELRDILYYLFNNGYLDKNEKYERNRYGIYANRLNTDYYNRFHWASEY